jgi:hypothetical protein
MSADREVTYGCCHAGSPLLLECLTCTPFSATMAIEDTRTGLDRRQYGSWVSLVIGKVWCGGIQGKDVTGGIQGVGTANQVGIQGLALETRSNEKARIATSLTHITQPFSMRHCFSSHSNFQDCEGSNRVIQRPYAVQVHVCGQLRIRNPRLNVMGMLCMHCRDYLRTAQPRHPMFHCPNEPSVLQ